MKNFIVVIFLLLIYSKGVSQQIIKDTVTYLPIPKTFLNTVPHDSILKYNNMRRLMINQKTMINDRFKYGNIPQDKLLEYKPNINSGYQNFSNQQNNTFKDKSNFSNYIKSNQRIKEIQDLSNSQNITNSLLSNSEVDFYPDLTEESILSSLIVKTEVVDRLDSINKLSDKALKNLRGKEEKINSSTKQISFEPPRNVFDKINFEVLLGLVDQPLQVDYLSPALGYLLTKKMTLGAGPNIFLNKADDYQSSKFGMRSFLRQDIYKSKVYLQLEDVSHLNKEGVADIKEKLHRKLNHSISAGTGYMMSFGKYMDLNFALFYHIMDNANLTDQRSPFSLRMGITSK